MGGEFQFFQRVAVGLAAQQLVFDTGDGAFIALVLRHGGLVGRAVRCDLDELVGWVHRAFFAVFLEFSVTRNPTIFLTSSSGSGLSSGNCTAPFEVLYSLNSFWNALIPLGVG